MTDKRKTCVVQAALKLRAELLAEYGPYHDGLPLEARLVWNLAISKSGRSPAVRADARRHFEQLSAAHDARVSAFYRVLKQGAL